MNSDINTKALKGIVPDKILNNLKNNIFGLACGGTITQNTTRPVVYTISGGKAPYTNAELLMDGSQYALLTIPTAGVQTTHNLAFPAMVTPLGSHTFAIRITDSCTPTPQVTVIGSCTMTVVAPVEPCTVITGSFSIT